MRPLPRSGMVRAALLALVGSLGLVGWSASRAVQQPGSAAAVRGTGRATPPAERAREGYPAERLMAAVGKDPFHPERRAPRVAFALPASPTQTDTRAAPRDTGNGLQLVGTAVEVGGGSVAMCQWIGGGPRLVHIGEKVLGLTLTRVRPGIAEFTTESGTAVVLRVPRAGT